MSQPCGPYDVLQFVDRFLFFGDGNHAYSHVSDEADALDTSGIPTHAATSPIRSWADAAVHAPVYTGGVQISAVVGSSIR